MQSTTYHFDFEYLVTPPIKVNKKLDNKMIWPNHVLEGGDLDLCG
jgi:hypothetical protein